MAAYILTNAVKRLMTSQRLSQKSLSSANSGIQLPTYDRSKMKSGIVHLGVGAFHRAHQAVFVDDCLKNGEMNWAITAASLRSGETRDALAPQDNLYTLVTRDNTEERLRVIGSINEIIVAPESPELLLASLTSSFTKIVSMTITEKGYNANLTTGDLLFGNADVIRDLEGKNIPRTFLAYLTNAIFKRRNAGIPPFTILCCDNLPHNGKLLHRVLTQYASAVDRDLGAFVLNEICCPCTMVDRIVPATTDEDCVLVSDRLGLEDSWPVVAEPFCQWVIEDNFPTGRPEWETSGVEFVKNVEPFEHMKLRLLNGAHSAIAAIGRVAGVSTVAETVGVQVVRKFIKAYWDEVIRTLPIQLDGQAYANRLLTRFNNRSLAHRTSQIATDASQKIRQRIVCPLVELLAHKTPAPALTFVVAAWIQSCAGRNELGEFMPVNDPVFEAWSAKPNQSTASAEEIVDAYLDFSLFLGKDLPTNTMFRLDLITALEKIRRLGVLAAVERSVGPIPLV